MLIMKRMALVAFLLCFAAAIFTVQAQDDNLLTNGDFEDGFSGRGRGDYNIPNGWNAWFAESPRTEVWMNLQPVVFPHRGPDPDPVSGSNALNANRGYATFTLAIYQQVNVEAGTNVQAESDVFLRTCNPGNSRDGKCASSSEGGARVRIGIDPNGGTDPNDSDIVWSAEESPHDRWAEVRVDATASGGTVTVFLYATQNTPTQLNNVYWDDAELKRGGGGGGGGAPAAPTAPPFASFVTAQQAQADGSIVHVVMSGDTLDSIAYAYGVTRDTILTLNSIPNPRAIQIGQELVIKPAGDANASEDEGDEDSTDSANADGGESGEQTSSEQAAAPAVEPTLVDVAPVVPPTAAPPAPVVSGAVPAADPSALGASVCVLVFDDINQNRIQEQGELLLPGGTVALTTGGALAGNYTTDGVSEPHCFSSLTAGDYSAVVQPPPGYALTTPSELQLLASPGSNITIAFGAFGAGAAPVQPVDAAAPAAALPGVPGALTENAAMIAFAGAGILFVISMGTALILRGG